MLYQISSIMRFKKNNNVSSVIMKLMTMTNLFNVQLVVNIFVMFVMFNYEISHVHIVNNPITYFKNRNNHYIHSQYLT
jgi:hypothetical protein